MPEGPLPPSLARFVAKPRQAVVAVLCRDGAPVTAGTWYGVEDGRLVLCMAAAGRRARHLQRDPRVARTIFGESWYDHVSIVGRVVDWRADPDLADLDRLSLRYEGEPYPERSFRSITALVEIDRWHTWGTPGTAG